ncbi:MAG: hypothetical protein AAF252_08025 [Pseudomonadota bacterium]
MTPAPLSAKTLILAAAIVLGLVADAKAQSKTLVLFSLFGCADAAHDVDRSLEN